MSELRPCIDFQITQNCNYRCLYCTQSKNFVEGKLENASDEVIDGFFNLISNLDEPFEITISGGEPLVHPRFFEVLEKIKFYNHKVSIVSNFSFPVEKYEKIAEILGENLILLFVSFHPAQVNDHSVFAQKANYLKEKLNEKTNFHVASVLTDDNASILKNLESKLKTEFFLQHMRLNNSFVEYTGESKAYLNSKDPGGTINKDLKTFGKICEAGRKFLVVYQDGTAYRCYSSRLIKEHILGNVKDSSFKLFDCAKPCLLPKCTCPKPILHGMLQEDETDFAQAAFLTFINAINLPFLMLKNSSNIKTKLVQKLFFNKK